MSSKIWIENDMYLVDEEVYNYIELLETKIWVEGNPRINVIRQHHLDQLQTELKEVKKDRDSHSKIRQRHLVRHGKACDEVVRLKAELDKEKKFNADTNIFLKSANDDVKRLGEYCDKLEAEKGKLEINLDRISNLCTNCCNLSDAQEIANGNVGIVTEDGCYKCSVDKLQTENDKLQTKIELLREITDVKDPEQHFEQIMTSNKQLQAENEELKAKIWVAVNPMQREEL